MTARTRGTGRPPGLIAGDGGRASRLVVCAALGIEARAVRRGLPADVAVVRTGMGTAAATRAALPVFDALAVAGFGGALDAGLRPGDVLVATEVRFGGEVLPCPWAALLTGELRRVGLRAYAGPLVTRDRVVTRAGRRRLADTGALGVDMEAGPLARVADGRPFAAVRVIVDTPRHPLPHPAIVRNGLAARRTLRRVGPGLTRWATNEEVRT